ncbi:MAG TPA: CRISPR system precrRNA processing endoribonuclease RAMP protein Cas6 [Firmicutes bacterium]|nr:CRISPR system precrRNA processing endoribonuclease RAMP protein Cas6 [Bacillota bacterium]
MMEKLQTNELAGLFYGEQQLIVYPIHVCMQMDGPLQPTRFWGSTLRGAFGAAFRSVTCVTKASTCEGCESRHHCPYAKAFDADAASLGAGRERGQGVPKPLLIRAEESRAGEVRFTVILIGQAVCYLPYLIHAVKIMGCRGLGPERVSGRLHKMWMINPVTWEETVVLAADSDQVVSAISGVTLRDIRKWVDGIYPTMLRIRFTSPWRIKRDGRLVSIWQFVDMAGAIRRRWAELNRLYGSPSPEAIIAPAAFDEAAAIQVQAIEERWKDQPRYSRRQGRRMVLGGIEGTYELRGNLQPYLPGLLFGSLVHIGKNVTFGMGHYVVESLPFVSLRFDQILSSCSEP